jgi:hypothetical protein
MSMTPRPWTSHSSLIRGPGGLIVATTLDNPEDAELIVRAVNAFDARVIVEPARATVAIVDAVIAEMSAVEIGDASRDWGEVVKRKRAHALDRVSALLDPSWQEWTA